MRIFSSVVLPLPALMPSFDSKLSSRGAVGSQIVGDQSLRSESILLQELAQTAAEERRDEALRTENVRRPIASGQHDEQPQAFVGPASPPVGADPTQIHGLGSLAGAKLHAVCDGVKAAAPEMTSKSTSARTWAGARDGGFGRPFVWEQAAVGRRRVDQRTSHSAPFLPASALGRSCLAHLLSSPHRAASSVAQRF